MLKVASFFCGIGGFDLGLENAGMKVVFQCERDRFRQSFLKKQMSFRRISDYLFENGYVNERGNHYNVKSIRDMVQQ
mgnify:CR=1 FL=1